MKKLILVGLVLSLSSCGWFDRKVAAITGGASKTCVDGVQYLQFTSGATVQYDRENKVVYCK